MSDVKQRVHRRYNIQLAVELSAGHWNEVLHLTTDNVSRGGLFIRTERPPELNARLRVTLRLPDGGTLVVDGVVVHAVTAERARSTGIAAGFGLRFAQESTADLGLLEAMAAAHAGAEEVQDQQEYISVPARLSSPDGVTEKTSGHRLLQLSVTKALAEQARDDGTYEIELPEVSIIDRPPPPEAILEAAAAMPPRPAASTAPVRIPVGPVAPPPITARQQAPAPAAKEPGPAMPRAARAAAPGTDVFGIDFGTTYSSIAVVRGQNIAILEDQEKITMFPSTVCFTEEGETLVGWPAREKGVLNPATMFRSPKRLIGRRYDDRNIQALLASSPLRTSAGPRGEVVADLFGETVSIPQVCSRIIRYVADIGSAAGVPVERVVLSSPVAFEAEKQAIQQAAELAGLTVLGMVAEPVAAAMAYGLGKQDQTVVVYDFGGGTFDFTLIRIRKGRFEVKGVAGDPWLGGDDFDTVLANHAADKFWRRTKVDLRQRQVEWQRLLFYCEAAKRRLSSETQVRLAAPAMLMSLKGPIALEMTLDRPLCEGLWSELVDRSLDAVAQCLEAAGVAPAEVDTVVMTGGVARIPLVQRRLHEHFNQQIELKVNPEHAVVMGNAICGRFVALSGRLPV